MSSAAPIYCFDTSALIEWWVRHYPPDLVPGLVPRMEALIASGRAIVPSFVLGELEVGGDELSKWAKAQPGFARMETEPVQLMARDLLRSYRRPGKKTKGINNADPFVIAMGAQTAACIVVTAEKDGSDANPKIPYVCKEVGVECIRFIDMWRREGWRLA